MRLQKYLALCGVASRRKSEELIASGRISVNHIPVREMGIQIDPEKDVVSMDNKVLEPEQKMHYILFYKPAGVVTTLSDPEGRRTVISYFPEIRERIFPVGRLDYDTEGLLIMTNDGNLAYHLTHPRHQVEKTYRAVVEGLPSPSDLKQLQEGIELDGRKTAPAKIRLISGSSQQSTVQITIHEGRNRQVKRMFEMIGHPVIYLKRERIGAIGLGNLKKGQWRYLTAKEIQYLFSIVK